jgi:hypothetical protein
VTTRLIVNPAWGEQIKMTQEYRDGMNTICEKAADSVRREAPERTGDFKDSIKTFERASTRGVMSDDWAAHIVEFGSANNPPYAPFRRGVRAAGLRLEESPKP